MTMAAWVSANMRRSPPIRMSDTSTMPPAIKPRPVATSMDETPAPYATGRTKAMRRRDPRRRRGRSRKRHLHPSAGALKGWLPKASRWIVVLYPRKVMGYRAADLARARGLALHPSYRGSRGDIAVLFLEQPQPRIDVAVRDLEQPGGAAAAAVDDAVALRQREDVALLPAHRRV